ncbi:MAG TPA: lasso RiPP family leader peptide-containing protein [Thermoanaerobaculia bacterium]
MTRRDPSSGEQAPTAPRREYVPPKLERLGTIRDLTQGLGMNGDRDSEHPPGQNKSLL